MSEIVLAQEHCDVAVVGAGTSGLALAAELKELDVGHVVVIEREKDAGGIPRHCGHYPFGVREYRRLLKGPQYARRNVGNALRRGVDIRTSSTVVSLREGGMLEISSNKKRYLLKAKRVVLCTGVRESSRAQRFIGGDRVKGVISTGALQSLSYLKHIRPFKRAVILGSELVSFSAVQTCRHLDVKPVAMIEEESSIIARRILQPYLWLNNIPLKTGVSDLQIRGHSEVEALRFVDSNGRQQEIECDGIVVSGRFRPESALLRLSHLDVDPHSGGPVVDQFGRASDPSYYCTGNILRPADTSGFCWREGVAAAHRIAEDLSEEGSRSFPFASVVAGKGPLAFVVPQRISAEPRKLGEDSFYLGVSKKVKGQIKISGENGQLLWSGRLNSRPARRIQIPIPKMNQENFHKQLRITIE